MSRESQYRDRRSHRDQTSNYNDTVLRSNRTGHSWDRYEKRSSGDRFESRSHVKEEQKEDWDAKLDARVVKEYPNFEVSGLLAEDQNQVKGVALTFSIPSDAIVGENWRLFEFDSQTDENTRVIKLEKSSCFLFGNDVRLESSENISFVLLSDPTCSKQHAVIQFRKKGIPYILDLASTNGTFLNGSLCDSGRYIELRDQDVLNFGKASSLEYVVMDSSYKIFFSLLYFLECRMKKNSNSINLRSFVDYCFVFFH